MIQRGNGNRQRIGGIRAAALDTQQPVHHRLHLFFIRLAGAGDRFFHLSGGHLCQ